MTFNPKEKKFILVTGMTLSDENLNKLQEYFQSDNGINMESYSSDKKSIENKRYFIQWQSTWNGRIYEMSTFEDTIWTSDRIIDKIKKNVPGVSSILVFEISKTEIQGLMNPDFWKFFHTYADMTSFYNNKKRYAKLKKLKELISKQENLKRKEAELKAREAEILKKKDIIDKEEELRLKEIELKKIEEELELKEKKLSDTTSGKKSVNKRIWDIFK